MRIVIVASGKVRDRAARELCDDYLGRIRKHTRIDELEAKDGPDLARVLPQVDVVVALEVWGKALSSEAFSQKLAAFGRQGKGDIAFLIGAAEGIPEELSRKAHFHLSLSSMTLPHRFARVLLLEQIYRGFSIQRGEPYAREG